MDGVTDGLSLPFSAGSLYCVAHTAWLLLGLNAGNLSRLNLEPWPWEEQG